MSGVDPAEHLGLVGYVMGICRVRDRFQPADADDIEGGLYLELIRCANNYDGTHGTFSTYAVSCLKFKVLQVAVRIVIRARKRKFTHRGETFTVRRHLFSEMRNWWRFHHDSCHLATVPSAYDQFVSTLPVHDFKAMLMNIVEPPEGMTAERWERRVDVFFMRAEGKTLEECGRRLGVTATRAKQLAESFLRRAVRTEVLREKLA